jgi:hypothetical protein
MKPTHIAPASSPFWDNTQKTYIEFFKWSGLIFISILISALEYNAIKSIASITHQIHTSFGATIYISNLPPITALEFPPIQYLLAIVILSPFAYSAITTILTNSMVGKDLTESLQQDFVITALLGVIVDSVFSLGSSVIIATVTGNNILASIIGILVFAALVSHTYLYITRY